MSYTVTVFFRKILRNGDPGAKLKLVIFFDCSQSSKNWKYWKTVYLPPVVPYMSYRLFNYCIALVLIISIIKNNIFNKSASSKLHCSETLKPLFFDLNSDSRQHIYDSWGEMDGKGDTNFLASFFEFLIFQLVDRYCKKLVCLKQYLCFS